MFYICSDVRGGRQMQSLIDADLDCTGAARLLMRMQADLDKREQLQRPIAKGA